MKFFLCFILWFSSLLAPEWQLDFEKAKQTARSEHKYILLNFSGSDWCGPCIRLRKEILDSDEFGVFAGQKLVLVNADFPRLKKNALSKEQQQRNDLLADKYNPKGIFPLTLLLTSDGKILRAWEGFPNLSKTEFIKEIQSGINASN